MKYTFDIEMTDTFGGEANYSWVTRKTVMASSYRGAVWIMSRSTGLEWHKTADYGDMVRYDSKSGATCMFIEQSD